MRAPMPTNSGVRASRFSSLAADCVRLVLFVLLSVLPAVRGAGTPADYSTDVWTSENGLPDSSVVSIAQTPDGYLWVGTYNGLARFDGVRFVTFDPANTPALAHARVRTLSVDDQGTLWINTFDGSMTSLREGTFAREWTGAEGIDPDVTLVSSRSNQVTFLLHRGSLRRKPQSGPAGTGWEDLIPTNRSVGTLCVADGEGTIWYRGSDKHLWRVTGKEFAPLPQPSGLTGSRVNCMTTDPQGRLWVGTDTEIAMWDGARFRNVTPTNAESPVDVEFLSVAEDGRWWAGVGGQVREAMGGRWMLEAEALKNVFTGNLSRMGARADHQGGVWLYDYGRGLSHVAAGGQVRRFGPLEGFPGDRVNCFYEDHEGNWWAGLDAEGLVRIRKRRFQTIDTGGPVSTKPARSVCEETNGTLWIGTLGDGLARWQAGVYTNLTMPGGTGKGFAFCVCPDAAGRLWVSAGDEDLYVSEPNGFKRVAPVVHGVKVILADKANRIWVGTKSGLQCADGESSDVFKQNQEIGRIGMRALSEDGHGNLWAGAEDGTLFRITTGKTNSTITAFHPNDSKTPHAIWSLLAENDGTVWAGTFRGGLLRLRDGRFTRFSIHEGLPDNIICQILPDGAGNLWIGSHQGIFRVAKSALNDFARGQAGSVPCTVYGRSDGLPSLECSGGYQPAAWRGQNGRLWFTTMKGAVSVQPEEIRTNLLAPPIVIEEILVDGKSFDANTRAQEKPVPAVTVYDREKKFLEVAPGKHQFEFRYTGLSLVSPHQVQFRYRLEGADEAWVEAGTRRFAQYNFLPPGRYRFRVIACNSDRVWNETGSALALEILPHFYETVWFHVLAGLAMLGLVAGAVRFAVTRQLHRKMEQLERQRAVERERARIAKDIHDDLGANLTLIAVLGDLAKKEKAEARIEKMSSTARQAVKSLDEIVWAVNPRNDTLAHLIDYTAQFMTDYLRDAGIRCLLDVPEQIPAREVPSNVRHNIFLVVKEALQNIVKHARATEVWLRVSTIPAGLRLVIEDNGCGFAGPSPDAWADGLGNMRQRLTEIGGECRVESRVGAGTVITIEFPWPHDGGGGSYLYPITGGKTSA
jgi:signal transduction histidine kinase/ligand-binding sensor domain-containing protein